MLHWADNNWMRIVGYIVVAALSLAAGAREDPDDSVTWRPFWPMTAAVLLTMAVGRAGGIAEWIADQFRDEAHAAGWYDARRPVQGAVVLSVGGAWAISVLTACWRIPERRRRYLPMVVAVLTLSAYVAVRMVSLHQIDGLLYRRDVLDLRVGALAEYLLVIGTGLCTLTSTRKARRRSTEPVGVAP